MSTFNIFENPNSETGTVTYKYAYGNSTNPTNWNASFLTKAQMQAIGDITGRYIKFQVFLDTDGSKDCTIGEGSIYCTINVPSKRVQLIKMSIK